MLIKIIKEIFFYPQSEEKKKKANKSSITTPNILCYTHLILGVPLGKQFIA